MEALRQRDDPSRMHAQCANPSDRTAPIPAGMYSTVERAGPEQGRGAMPIRPAAGGSVDPVLLIVLILIIVVIVALSRRSSRRIRRWRNPDGDVALLQQQGLPVLRNEEELAVALGVTMPQLIWLADRRRKCRVNGYSSHYHIQCKPKPDGSMRVLMAPRPKLKAAQRWILQHILGKIPLPEVAHGFRSGHSILTHAAPHADAEAVVCCDLRDFFHTISYPRVRGIFQSLGYGDRVAVVLALLCTSWLPGTRRRVLPQGAPSSPALSNLAARRLDRRLAGLAASLGYRYSRYADDCAFSGSPRPLGALIRTVRRIVRSEGFSLHEGKLRIHRRGARQVVTGVVVNQTPAVPRAERRRLRALLHQAQYTGLEAQNRTEHTHFTSYLQGKIAFIRMINPAHAHPLHAALRRVLPGAGVPVDVTTITEREAYEPGPDELTFND